MSKMIAKLTWLHNGNFGSVLQAVALQRYLLEKGYDVTDLDYNASLKEKLKNWIKNKNSLQLFVGKFEEATRKKSCKQQEKFELRRYKIEEFEKSYLKRSTLCRNPEQIRETAKKYDIFICGSDQIWSPALLNPIFYFDFVPNSKKKIAYAPSFGVMNTTREKKEKIARYLKSFDSISVRETQGQKFIEELIGKKVPVVVDPTLLIDSEIWHEYSQKVEYNKPYIFCYLLTPNRDYVNAVSNLAKNKGLKVIIVPTIKGPFDTGFEEMIDIGPAEWLSLIENASYVCTDSFHGCIFSLIFHKEFVLFKRFKDEDKASENSRIYTLAKMLEVEDRIIDVEHLERINNFELIDFYIIDRIIENKVNESKHWLIDALKNAEA